MSTFYLLSLPILRVNVSGINDVEIKYRLSVKPALTIYLFGLDISPYLKRGK